MHNYDLIMIISCVSIAIVGFLPTIPLMLLPFVRRLRGGAKAWMWVFASAVYLLNAGLVIAWAGDIVQNRSGDLSMAAFYGSILVYLLAPVFYSVFFRRGLRSFVYGIVVAALEFGGGVALGLVPLLYGITTEFDTLTRVLGVAGMFVPQFAAAAMYVVLACMAYRYHSSGEEDY